jgi:mannonate dehydratase
MGIDPEHPRCVPFYAALVRLRLPLLTHAGDEHAVPAADLQPLGDPRRLEAALGHGVRVVVAHCASLGESAAGSHFQSFARLMDQPASRGLLFGEISAVIQNNRSLDVVREIVARAQGPWRGRLLNASDYPLPGSPVIIGPGRYAAQGWLTDEETDWLRLARRHHPLLFDFALKRLLRVGGQALPAAVFHTRPFWQAA